MAKPEMPTEPEVDPNVETEIAFSEASELETPQDQISESKKSHNAVPMAKAQLESSGITSLEASPATVLVESIAAEPGLPEVVFEDLSAHDKALFLARNNFSNRGMPTEQLYELVEEEIERAEAQIDNQYDTLTASALSKYKIAQKEVASIQREIRAELQGQTIAVTPELRQHARCVIEAGLPTNEIHSDYISFTELKDSALRLVSNKLSSHSEYTSTAGHRVSKFETATASIKFYDQDDMIISVGNTKLVVRNLKNGRVKINSYQDGEKLSDKSGKLASYKADKLIQMVLQGHGLDRLYKLPKNDSPEEIYIPDPDIARRMA